MLQKRLFVCVLLIGCAAPLRASGEDITSVDEVIAKYIEAIGGREKLDAVKTMKATGKLIMGGGMEAPFTIEQKRPNKMRMQFSFQGMDGTQCFDGENGWFVMPFMGKTEPEQMGKDQADVMRDQADFDGPLVDYKKKGNKVELMGKDTVDGTDAYKIKVEKPDGSIEYHYLEAEYFIPIKVQGKREFQGTEMDYVVLYGDYKEVAGLLLPHSVQPQAGPGGSMTMEKIEINIPIDDDRFKMPEGAKTQAEAQPGETKPEKTDDDDGE